MTKNTGPRCGVNPTSQPDSPMDALAPFGFTDLDMPGDKRPVWQAIRAARSGA